MYDSFYYRKFTVEKNKDQTDYEYSCEITFKENTGRPAVTKLGTTPITVSIKNPIETEMLRVGTYNMFRGNAAIKLAYNKGHKSLPENHPIDTTGPADIWPMDTAFPGDYLIDIPDPEDLTAPDITHLKAGDYKIKMHIPTSMKPGYSTAAYKALMDANSVYPIQLKVIMDDPMFKDWPELQIRVDKTFKITPYKMPGIN